MNEQPPSPPRFTRRGFLAGTVAAALAACTGDNDTDSASTGADGTSGTPPSVSEPASSTSSTTSTSTTSSTSTTTTAPVVTLDPFTLGVAAGDPLADSLILWTRLLPDVPLPDTDVDVEWELATDAEFADIVASGTAPAVAALGHSVHVDVSGLEPASEYHYRFRVAGFESASGRARTFAAPGTMPDRFRFAFSSCQHWEHGMYAAYRDVVEQAAIDAFVFLGDYIYESASGGGAGVRTTGQDFECETLDQYRQRYALYHSDPLLQAAHANVPWIITWDDHEVDNNYAAAINENDDPPDVFLARRAAAYQAWYEHMPVRLDPPTGADYEIYRSFAHGDLIRFHVLDTRQHRSDQQRGEPFIESLGANVQVRDEQLATSSAQTMLGEVQRNWLIDGFASSTAVWDVIAQQVFMSGANLVGSAVPPVILPDTWDGYAGERRLLVEAIGQLADNVVVITGDFHSAAVADLRADPFDLSSPVVGSELMASSISSNFFDADPTVDALAAQALAGNPQLRWFDTRRGYTVCDVTADRWLVSFRALVDQLDEMSAVDVVSTWEITAGTPGPTRTS